MTESDLHATKTAAVLRTDCAGRGLKHRDQLGVTAVISVGDDGGLQEGGDWDRKTKFI